ncbi:TetR/AcrR family transcriptional regulator [Leucobacter massiliensis]|uniref:TetR family transcriptional regulator n=1 Tax=Leucobacter massiliensis TaxID=1686285 RepID=A0A2S9QPJ3_9MICO|nr:TetR/AcrR family transcriptional regulator [Leucobacter massiliensis]PRI11506.1 TetR family transcriptional regulator [Leucobacter massiliensis]
MNRPEDPKPEAPQPEAHKPEGLRARKRRATEHAIERSAVTLALQEGVENVTVEAICEMADISRSTFFNYFSSRDHAIVGRSAVVPEGDEAHPVFDASPDDLPLAIMRLYFAAVGHSRVEPEVARLRERLVAEQPEARRLTLISLLDSGQHLSAAATSWLKAHPERVHLESAQREATMTVSLVLGVIISQLGTRDSGTRGEEADEREFQRILEDYRRVL